MGNNNKKKLEEKFPVTFPGNVGSWVNGVLGWHIHGATPGLYTLDIEHVPEEVVLAHNDPESPISIASEYRRSLCPHKCPTCFNEENIVYSKERRIMTLADTFKMIDDAIRIAKLEGHDFRSVKFLGPGELLMNPQLFEVVERYARRGIRLNIFTKGALLGSDELAQKVYGMTAKALVEKLAGFDHVGLLLSFQSFDEKLQDSLVTSRGDDGAVLGLQGYSRIREKALKNLFASRFYENGRTNRVCAINAPIIPENVEESFDIYRFFVERGTPVVMTPSMVSGKGCQQVRKQEQLAEKDWHEKLVELYARIYAFNVRKGIQTEEQIGEEGIASYVGAEPCNQVATGLYVRADGTVQMCPGRFDKTTIFGNVLEKSLKSIWDASPNKARGKKDPQCLVNNLCPAKDGIVFPSDFYERVMERYKGLVGT